ncbi:MAG TPA: DNA polymerase III subunit alpha [Candidatus Acidoferrum sp.]|jgi:DNA-directed DNA polymerase III PolC
MFVHLHCHSHYSFLQGVNPPDEIIVAAVEQEMTAVALTDSNGMYAAIPFYQAALAAKIKPIVGVVVEIDADTERRKREIPPLRADKNHRPSSPFAHARGRRDDGACSVPMVLLAMDMAGYSNLCQLTTIRHIGAMQLEQATFSEAESDGQPITLEELAAHSDGVIALCPAAAILRMEGNWEGVEKNRALKDNPSTSLRASGHGTRNLGIRAGTAPDSEGGRYISLLQEIFGNRLYLEVQHLSAGDGRTLREAQRLGCELDIPLVATNNVHFLRPEEHLPHRAVNAIRTGNLLTTVAPPEITTEEAWFKPAAEMQRLFPDHPELLRATLEIADRCNLELELGELILPEFPVPEGQTPSSVLENLCFSGAKKRYHPPRPEVQIRLARELQVIEKWHLAPYFLLVWDIVEEARRLGIPAVARGSAASSMVTYCLGISRVCPLRWGLYFERFLNEQRGDCPDIDIDICGARHDELLNYVYKRWGAEHVAMIGSFVTMHARLAIREVAKVFGVPHSEVNHFTKRLPHRPVSEILQAIRQLPQCRNLPVDEEPWRTILQVALRLDGAPRHLSIHPCGTVISAKPLAHLVPLERATKGIVVTQYDMNAIEALGLIKMDLLGQRGFTTMALALDNIEKEIEGIKEVEEKSSVAADGITPCPKPREIDFDVIPENDPLTCKVIASGRTIGVFQVESPAMRSMLRMMAAQTLEEVALALALIRPGAAEYGSKELFIKRLRGKEPVAYAHEHLEPILRDTLGVCIYQEQVMQISQLVGKLSLAEADLVRRASAKFSGRSDRERLRGKFLKAAGMMGLTTQQRQETWQMVEKFAGFGFCKAHAATYADISYRMAYLKTHHTAEFLAAMCSAGAGFYHVSAYVEEAKRWGISVRLPSVNRSRMEYTTEPVEEDERVADGTRTQTGKRAIRVGLLQVRGLRIETIRDIVSARESHGPFRSLEDFLHRVPAERDEIESLIKCGAFDDVYRMTRPAMLWQWNLLQSRGQHKHAWGQVGSNQKQIPHPQNARVRDDNLGGGAGWGGDRNWSAGTGTSGDTGRYKSGGAGIGVRSDAAVGGGASVEASTGTTIGPRAGATIANTMAVVAAIPVSPVLFAEMEPDDLLAAALSEMRTSDYTPEQTLRYEREILEVCVSGHPLDFLPRHGEVWSDELPKLHGKRVTLCGWVVTYRHVGTKNYRNMMFVTLEDQRGLFEAILFPDVYDKYGGLVYETRAMRVTGFVQDDENINGESLEKLRE